MSNTIQGAGSPIVAPELLQEASRIAQMMGGPATAPGIASDAYAAGGSQRGSVPGAAPLLDPGTAPAQGQGAPAPEVFVNDQTGQLVNHDGSAYLGRNLYVAQDQNGQDVVVDEHDQIVNLAQLEAQHSAAPAQGATAPAGAAAAPPQELLIGQDGRLLGPNQQPYLGQELYVAQDEFGNQVVVDAQNTVVNLEDLEARHARGELPPAPAAAPAQGAQPSQGASTAPAPPQFYMGQNNQIVDRSGQPYLGQTLFVRQDNQGNPQVVDGQGQTVDFDALIARAGYNPQAEPVDNAGGQAPAQGAPAPGPAPSSTPGAPAATGSVNPGGYARNASALLINLWRNRTPAATPPAPTPGAGDDGAVQAARTQAPRRVRPDATTRVSRRNLTPRGRTTSTPAEPATPAAGTSRGTLVRGPDGRFRRIGPGTEPQTSVRQAPVRNSRGRTNAATSAEPAAPASGTSRGTLVRGPDGRFRRIGPGANAAAPATPAGTLSGADRTAMIRDVHQLRQARQQVQTLEGQIAPLRSMGNRRNAAQRAQLTQLNQDLEGARRQVRDLEGKVKDWDARVTAQRAQPPVVPPAAGPRTVRVSDANRQAFLAERAEMQRSHAMIANLPRGAQRLPQGQRLEWIGQLRTQQLAGNQLRSAEATIQRLEGLGNRISAAQRRELTRARQFAQLARKDLTTAETRLGELRQALPTARTPRATSTTSAASRSRTPASAPEAPAAPVAGIRRLPVRGPNGRFVAASESAASPAARTTSRRAATTSAARETNVAGAASRASTVRALPQRGPNGRFVSANAQGTSAPGSARTASTAHEAPSGSRISLAGRILPAALLANDAYNLYQGVNHWNDQGNNGHMDDALRVGGSAISAVASGNALFRGNVRSGVAMHITGLAMNTLGTILNDQD